jgi:hypothetical protein
VAAVFSHWRTTVAEFKEANAKIEALWRQWPAGTPTLTWSWPHDRRRRSQAADARVQARRLAEACG